MKCPLCRSSTERYGQYIPKENRVKSIMEKCLWRRCYGCGARIIVQHKIIHVSQPGKNVANSR